MPAFECQKGILTLTLVSTPVDRSTREIILVQILVKSTEQHKYIKKESYAKKMTYVSALLFVSTKTSVRQGGVEISSSFSFVGFSGSSTQRTFINSVVNLFFFFFFLFFFFYLLSYVCRGTTYTSNF